MAEDIVLSYYPLVQTYVDDLSKAVGRPVRNLVISSLNMSGSFSLALCFLALRVHSVYLPHPTPDFDPFLPLLRLLARLPGPLEVVRVDSGFRFHPETKAAAFTSGLMLAARMMVTLAALPWRYLRLRHLVKTPRQAVCANRAREVLYLKTNLWSAVVAGGSISHTVGVVSALAECGHPVTYVSPTHAPELKGVSDATICPLLLPFGFLYPREFNIYCYEGTLNRWRKRQHKREFAFVYHRLTLGSTAAIDISHRLGIPLVVEYNGSELWINSHWGTALKLPQLGILAEQAILRHANLFVAVSGPLRDELVARGVEPERIVVCPNGVDPNRFDPAAFTEEQTGEMRTRLGIPADHIVATFVGTFGPWHGAMIAADALIDLYAKRPALNVHMVFVGDGPGRSAAEEKLAKSGLAERCTFTGLVSPGDVPLYLAASDILLAPHVPNSDSSEFFGSPTKLFEYMAMERPILASSLGQIAEVLEGAPTLDQLSEEVPSGAAGILLEPANPQALAEGLAFLSERPDWRRSCGANGRARVLRRHTWTAHAQEILAGLSRVLPPPPARAGSKTTILINAVHAKSGGGVTYLRNILPLWGRRDDLVPHLAIQRGQEELMREIAPGIPQHVLPARPRLATVLVQEQFDIPQLARSLGADVIYSPANYGPVWGAKTVILLRNSFDVRTIDARLSKRIYWLGVKLLSWISFLACRRAITVTHHARKTFTQAFHADADLRFAMVHHGVSPSFGPAETDGDRRPQRLLAVSDIYIQKNLETVIEAVAFLVPRYPEVALDIAGRVLDPEYFQYLTQVCVDRGLSGRIHFLGSVPSSRVGELLHQAKVFVFPSLVETFGNPLLEAMASGLPVVCSAASAMPEVAGDAALYAEPGNAGQFAQTIATLFEDQDLWEKQSAKGLERARQFNWQRTADRTAAILIDVAGE